MKRLINHLAGVIDRLWLCLEWDCSFFLLPQSLSRSLSPSYPLEFQTYQVTWIRNRRRKWRNPLNLALRNREKKTQTTIVEKSKIYYHIFGSQLSQSWNFNQFIRWYGVWLWTSVAKQSCSHTRTNKQSHYYYYHHRLIVEIVRKIHYPLNNPSSWRYNEASTLIWSLGWTAG